MNLEFKSFPMQVKAVDVETGVFEGYASVFGVVDGYGDVVVTGAFAKTLAERGDRVKVCWQHQWDMPIGKPIAMEEHGPERLPKSLITRAPEATGGLFIRAQVSPTTQGRDALVLLRDGVVDELSIGYDTIKARFDEERGIRYLLEVRLWEFSPVTWGANHAAIITAGMKGLAPDLVTMLREVLALPDGVGRLETMLRGLKSAEPSAVAQALTARARALSIRLKLMEV